MAESYKLVFRGEVLEGQHPAVVRKRLGESGGFGTAQLDKLFSGRPVVVKRAADAAAAARIQAMFRKAGARLRVLPADGEDAAGGAAPQPDAEAATGTEDESAAGAQGLQLLPPGSDLLRPAERPEQPTRDVDTSALSLEGARFSVAEPAPQPPGPDVSHLSLAETGADLGVGRAPPAEPVPVPEFDIAEPGADLRESKPEPEPAAPDTSHLSLTPQ